MSTIFEDARMKLLESHSARRNGERLRRLREGHGYGEKLFRLAQDRSGSSSTLPRVDSRVRS